MAAVASSRWAISDSPMMTVEMSALARAKRTAVRARLPARGGSSPIAAGAGTCILDWDWARDLLLDRELIAEDLDLGDRLEEVLAPNIWIRRAAA